MVQTIAELFYEALKFDLPDAFAAKADGAYRPVSHRELGERVERLALALRARGLAAGDRLAILCENRPEWAAADFACALLGVVTVPIYHSLTAEQTVYILQDSGARCLVVSTPAQLAKVAPSLERLPDLDTLVLVEGSAAAARTVVPWSRLMEEGAALDARRSEVRAQAQARRPEDLLTLIYTSGTTAEPKGAMLTQGNVASNITATVEVAVPALKPARGDRCLSVLPLSHIFERTGGHYAMFHLGIAIYYAESLISMPQNLLEVRPAVLMAVPRIFEKVYAKVRDAVQSGGLLRRMVFRWAACTCRRVVRHLYLDRRPPFFLRIPWRIADRLLLAKVREKTGGRLRFCVSGGASLNPRIMEFFWAMGVPIYEGYGLTETSPILTLNRLGRVRPGYVGQPVLKTWDGRPFLKLAEDGEILCQGPNVMRGYWKQEELSREVFDPEGYFRTGDVGQMDPQGRVKITDRKKEIIVTSGGKNVAPQPIENELREDFYIEQAVVVGDHRNHLAALIVPHFPALRAWCERKSLAFKDDAEMVGHPRVVAKIMTRVNRVNAQLPAYERIRRIALLAQEMTAAGGLLTPTLKVKRRVVNEAFQDVIEGLYRNGSDRAAKPGS
ncbi:MAG: long-chain fatty acid--CoA ligase [Holophaga sp.]